MDLAKQLRLDANVLHAHAEAYYGFALVERKEPLPFSHQINYIIIAASYWAVVDQKRSRECFQEAANLAYKLANLQDEQPGKTGFDSVDAMEWLGRANTLSVCSGQMVNFGFPIINFQTEQNHFSPNQIAAALMVTVNSWLQSGRKNKEWVGFSERLMSLANRFEDHTVGRMRIPMVYYTRLVMDVFDSHGDDWASRWLHEFGGRVSEQVKLAQTSRQHWKNLHMGLLPIEPEILSATIVLVRSVAERRSQKSFFGEVPEQMQAYGMVANTIVRGEDSRQEI